MNHSEILRDVKEARILVIGDVMLDRYWWGSVDRISPEAPVPVVRLDRTSMSPGGAANVAANLAGLGSAAHLISIAGDDLEANEVEGLLKGKGVNVHLARSSQRRTIVKTRIVAHSQHVVRIDQEDVEPLTNNEAEHLTSLVSNMIGHVDAVILSDYAKGTLGESLLARLISLIREAGKPIFIDPKGSRFDKYMGATVITPNRREAMAACSIDENLSDPVSVAGSQLSASLNADVLITDGDRGMTLFEREKDPHHLDSFAQEVFDVTGAGDTVIAAFAAAVASGRSMKEAAWLANISAGIVVGKQGTTAVDPEMIEEFLKHDIHSQRLSFAK